VIARRLAVLLAFAMLAAATVLVVVQSATPERHTLVATFPRTTSLYEGAKVKVLGVDVGKVDSIKVVGTAVQVTISYDENVDLPADVHALIVPPSIVGDRFVQLAPAYDTGPVLEDNARLGLDRTGVPIELDETYQSLDELAAGLGPNGANQDGSLSRLISATARNLDGRGRAVNTTIRELAAAIDTLAGSSDDANGTVTNVSHITHMLAGKDAQMRKLVSALARVAAQLSGQRRDIATSVTSLRQALALVATFVKANRSVAHEAVTSLTSVSSTLAQHTDDLAGLVDMTPTGLTSLLNIYVPKNWDPSKPWLTPVGGRTGSQALRGALTDDLDLQLGFTLSALCDKLPPAQAAQLASFCTTLQQVGGSLGALVTQATRSGALAPVTGATTLDGLLGGESQ